MFIIYGEKSYGKVDRVPGLCYVVTVFAHLNYIPLVPLRSYIVLEGTESGGEFRGKEIGVSLKSALAGYARVWIGALTVLAAFGAGVELNRALQARQMDGALVGLIAAAALGLLSFFISGKVGAGFQVAAHVVSAVMWFVLSGGAPNRRAADATDFGLFLLFLANVGLLVFGLTRLFDHAGANRKRELFRELGAQVPEDDDEPQESRWEDWDASEDRRRRR